MSKVKGKTLVRILAEELKEWPECKFGCDSITQDKDGCLNSTDTGKQPEFIDGSLWSSFASTWIEFCGEVVRKELAKDYSTAIVTRAQWQAERAKLSKPKANKDGWIRHRGGKCPVEEGALIDVRHRDGEKAFGVEALNSVYALEHNWLHDTPFKADGEIMAWRRHKPEQCVEAVPSAPEIPSAKYFDGPLQWRDRIAEIDAEEARLNTEHRNAIEALEEERVSLVQRLADEGLQLIGKRDE